jgi:hypothetical protein
MEAPFSIKDTRSSFHFGNAWPKSVCLGGSGKFPVGQSAPPLNSKLFAISDSVWPFLAASEK